MKRFWSKDIRYPTQWVVGRTWPDGRPIHLTAEEFAALQKDGTVMARGLVVYLVNPFDVVLA